MVVTLLMLAAGELSQTKAYILVWQDTITLCESMHVCRQLWQKMCMKMTCRKRELMK